MDLWHTLFFSSFVVFCHADFADDADFFSWDYFVPQISQIYTDFSSWDYFVTQISQMTQIFLRGIILSHRFHRYTQIFLRGIIFVTQISQMTQIFLRWIIFVPQISQIYTDFSSWDYFCHADFADDADFSSWDYFCPTDLHRFFWISGESLFPIPGGICNDRTGRLCENPWVIVSARNLRINSVSSDDEKICVICEICVT